LWRRDTILQKVKRMAHLVCRDLIQFSGLEVDHALNKDLCLLYSYLLPMGQGVSTPEASGSKSTAFTCTAMFAAATVLLMERSRSTRRLYSRHPHCHGGGRFERDGHHVRRNALRVPGRNLSCARRLLALTSSRYCK
jgi:hypothetical protein